MVKVGKQERIDPLVLLGATFVDKKRDMLGALKLWKRAMEERYEDGVLVIPKALVKSPISAYENTLEVESVAALEEIISGGYFDILLFCKLLFKSQTLTA